MPSTFSILWKQFLQPALDISRLWRYPKLWLRFRRDWKQFAAAAGPDAIRFEDCYPQLHDRTSSTGFDPHYIYQGFWSMRLLTRHAPALHVDIASDHRWAVWLAATGRRITFVDLRPLEISLPNFDSRAGTILQIPYPDQSLESVSSLHVVEHIGLGRYGDPIDPEGMSLALKELVRVVAPGGRLYLTTPIGRPRICYNAHRISDPVALIERLRPLELETFGAVDDQGRFHETASPADFRTQSYACGLYVFRRPATTTA